MTDCMDIRNEIERLFDKRYNAPLVHTMNGFNTPSATQGVFELPSGESVSVDIDVYDFEERIAERDGKITEECAKQMAELKARHACELVELTKLTERHATELAEMTEWHKSRISGWAPGCGPGASSPPESA